MKNSTYFLFAFSQTFASLAIQPRTTTLKSWDNYPLHTLNNFTWQTHIDEPCNIKTGDTTNFICIKPNIANEFNQIKNLDHISGFDLGIYLYGKKDYLSFWLDGRIFTESHTSSNPYSLDGNFTENQIANEHGSKLSYSSYSRYIANMDIDTRIGNIGFSQNSLHWGPGVFQNLTLNRNSGAFPFAYWYASLGSMNAMSFFGRFNQAAYGKWDDNNFNYIVGHRYEWNATKNLNFGLSELLISTKDVGIDWPTVVPIVPLFMQKGSGFESNNNGNISFDLNYTKDALRFYSEFLIDDIQSPSSLFDNFWANKWAVMFGSSLNYQFKKYEIQHTLEYSRIEPWVYTHYQSYRLQFDNHGIPFGNPDGPNSQSIILSNRIENKNTQLGLDLKWLWKGTDPGSQVQDPAVTDGDIKKFTNLPSNPHARNSETKTFLSGAYGPNWTISPSVGYKWKWIWLQSRLGLRDGPMDYQARLMVEY